MKVIAGRLDREHAQHEQGYRIDLVREPRRAPGRRARHGRIQQAACQEGKAEAQEAGQDQRPGRSNKEAPIGTEVREEGSGLAQVFPSELGPGQIAVQPGSSIVLRHMKLNVAKKFAGHK